MKVIFLRDVPHLARAGEMKEVADGYGRNFLIPRKLALLASQEARQSLEVKLAIEARHQAQTEAELLELAKQLAGKEFIIPAKTGGAERLYGSVTAADIASEIENATGLSVDKRKVELDESIRQVGSYEVTIRLAQNIMPKITVKVTEQAT